MSKFEIFFAFLCAVSLILVNGLPAPKQNEDENGVASLLTDGSNVLKSNSEADIQSRITREAQHHHHHHRYQGGGGGGSNAEAGSFNFNGGGRGGSGFTGSGAQAGSGGRGRGGGGSRAQSESFNVNTPFGQFSGSESSAQSGFGRRG